MIQRHRKQLHLMADINVTNLLDTAFLLLITFMVVAPQLNHGLKINPPKVSQAPSLQKDPNKTVLVLIEKKADTDTVDSVMVKRAHDKEPARIEVEKLKSRIEQMKAERSDLAVIIEADQESMAGTFVRALAEIKAAGIESIGVSTKVEAGKGEPAPKTAAKPGAGEKPAGKERIK